MTNKNTGVNILHPTPSLPQKKGALWIQRPKNVSQMTSKKVELVTIVWVNYNDLTVLPHWKSWFIIGKSSPFMALIQVSEIL